MAKLVPPSIEIIGVLPDRFFSFLWACACIHRQDECIRLITWSWSGKWEANSCKARVLNHWALTSSYLCREQSSDLDTVNEMIRETPHIR